MRSYQFLNEVNDKELASLPKNTIFIDQETHFKIGRDEGIQFGYIGMNGTGKTYNLLLMCNQFGNFGTVFFFDPQNRVLDILKKQGEVHKWISLKITPDKEFPNRFVIRAMDLHPRILSLLAHRTTAKDQFTKRLLREFMELPDEQKTYETLRKMFQSNRLEAAWEELDMIIDPEDLGTRIGNRCLTLREMQDSGMYCINISEITEQDMAIGFVTESIIGWRSANVWSDKKHILFAIDESQQWCANNTLTGKAFSLVFGKGRIYRVSGAVSGVNPGQMHPTVKGQLKILMIHKLGYGSKPLKTLYGIYLDDEMIARLPTVEKGWCIYYNKAEEIYIGEPIRPNQYYKVFEEKDYVYEGFEVAVQPVIL